MSDVLLVLQRYCSLFVGRRDDYAVQLADGRYRRVGRPFTLQVLRAHLRGTLTAGTYVRDARGRCRFAVFDADMPDGLAVLAQLQRCLADRGLVSYLEASRRGGHLWLFLAEYLLASQLRAWLLPLCPAGVEFYPKQDEGPGYGSLLRLPLGVHRLSGYRYRFLVWDGAQLQPVVPTFAATLSWLADIQRVPVPGSGLPSAAPRGPVAGCTQHTSLARPTGHTWDTGTAPTIRAWGAEQDALQVIGHYIALDASGLGRCPFGWHHQSGQDRHPSFRVYAPAQPGGSCWYCYAWHQGGTLFDFLCQYLGLDARTLWQRIQRGEQF
jgi:hypothetical protein